MTPVTIDIGNTSEPSDATDNHTKWTVFARPVDDSSLSLIKSVTFSLHETFSPRDVTVVDPPFAVTRIGWGTFQVIVSVVDVAGKTHVFTHDLCFDHGRTTANRVWLKVEDVNDLVNDDDDDDIDDDIDISALNVGGGKGTNNEYENSEKSGTNGAGSGTKRDHQKKKNVKGKKNITNDNKPRMTDVDWREMHGSRGSPDWPAPFIAARCDAEARPGYKSKSASEYVDDPITLQEKIKTLAQMIRESPACVAYTGAGLSFASGIDDYATKAQNSVAKTGRPKLSSPFAAQPTFAHRMLGELYRRGMLHHWVQQNHDGLPEKAGVPPYCINNIHGAWYDPSNPVVPMSGSLRSDLCDWLYEWEEKADLTLALGTSLCGMNADRMVETPAAKAKRGEASGAVIVSLQQTQYDAVSALRIFAKLEDFAELLARELSLHVPTPSIYKPKIPKNLSPSPDIFLVPYSKKTGKKLTDDGSLVRWNLQSGAKIRVTQGPGKGFEGRVDGKNSEGHYRVTTPCQREGSKNHGKGLHTYILGSWWTEAAVNGMVDRLPIVNI